MALCADDEQLKRDFSCKICFEPFSRGRRHPISLNCGHTFCARCVIQLGRADTMIWCGICRKGTYSDFRQLGRNVTLLDLLEHANLLSKDDPTEMEEEENTLHIQPWGGANHFLSNNALTNFLDRHAHLRSIVHQLLLPTQWAEFDEQLDAIRYNLFTIEEKLREAGDSFVSQEGQLDQLEHKFHCAMTEYYHQQQQSSLNDVRVNFVPIRWAISDDSDDDINVLAVRTADVGPISTTNSMPSDDGRSPFGVRRPRGCPPLSQNSERRRTRGTNNGASFGIPALNFVPGVDGDDQPTNFNTWGVIGSDEWDQSTRSNENYMDPQLLTASAGDVLMPELLAHQQQPHQQSNLLPAPALDTRPSETVVAPGVDSAIPASMVGAPTALIETGSAAPNQSLILSNPVVASAPAAAAPLLMDPTAPGQSAVTIDKQQQQQTIVAQIAAVEQVAAATQVCAVQRAHLSTNPKHVVKLTGSGGVVIRIGRNRRSVGPSGQI